MSAIVTTACWKCWKQEWYDRLTDCVEIATSREKSNLYCTILKHWYRMPNRFP